jgi:hypothetical protein
MSTPCISVADPIVHYRYITVTHDDYSAVLQHICKFCGCATVGFGKSGPTSQDAETPSYYGLNPFCYIVNAGGGTRSDSEFRRPEMCTLVRLVPSYKKS